MGCSFLSPKHTGVMWFLLLLLLLLLEPCIWVLPKAPQSSWNIKTLCSLSLPGKCSVFPVFGKFQEHEHADHDCPLSACSPAVVLVLLPESLLLFSLYCKPPLWSQLLDCMCLVGFANWSLSEAKSTSFSTNWFCLHKGQSILFLPTSLETSVISHLLYCKPKTSHYWHLKDLNPVLLLSL